MFLRTKPLPERVPLTVVVDFPVGTFVESDKGIFYIAKNKTRLKVPNDKVLSSWRVVNVPFYTEDALVQYIVAGRLPYRDGTLIRNFADRGKDYLVSGGKLRLITRPEWLQWLGLNENDAIMVSQEEFKYYSLGDALS
jgi:hypothetical protein